ncbi:lytic transglycosylase domain-containing protein [Candidatus Parcubacteria bacterium]|nr:lytic transglycosylase domain-containing protein [Patescibacteria group bacterium]MBU4309782.1 lytic transglycosylase domain-containing protein [Patescibacteria group bacterium]MBU4578121.1 lytic transglycosylase domain-containing protein [Patescibacteria group bacterium]MCG2696658.1 lytic transglycosylase domain-containing protein [Candidatus Parcubacteria bacterium]
MKRWILISSLVLCSLLLFMAHNREKQAQTAPAINEPPKETKLSPNNSSLEPDSDKNKFLSREYYRIDQSSVCEDENTHDTAEPLNFDFDLKKFAKKMREHDKIIGPASQKHQMPKKLIAAVIRVESNWDTLAVSKNGAKGLMQLNPITQEETEVKNPFNAKENVDGGTEYLGKMCKEFGSIELGLIANNIGPTRLRKILAGKERGKIPPSAKKYAQKVLYLYQNV